MLWLVTVGLLHGRYVLTAGVAPGNIGPLVAVLHEPSGIGVVLLVYCVSVSVPALVLLSLGSSARAHEHALTPVRVGRLVLDAGVLLASAGHLWFLVGTPQRLSSVGLIAVTLALTLLSILAVAVRVGSDFQL